MDSVRPNANRARYRFDWESIGSSTLVGWKNKPGPHLSESHDSLYLSMILEGQDHHVTAPVEFQKNRALAHPDERYVVEYVETALSMRPALKIWPFSLIKSAELHSQNKCYGNMQNVYS